MNPRSVKSSNTWGARKFTGAGVVEKTEAHLPGNICHVLSSWLGTRSGNFLSWKHPHPGLHKKGNGEEEETAGKGETKEKAEPSWTSKMRARRDTAPHYLGRS